MNMTNLKALMKSLMLLMAMTVLTGCSSGTDVESDDATVPAETAIQPMPPILAMLLTHPAP